MLPEHLKAVSSMACKRREHVSAECGSGGFAAQHPPQNPTTHCPGAAAQAGIQSLHPNPEGQAPAVPLDTAAPLSSGELSPCSKHPLWGPFQPHGHPPGWMPGWRPQENPGEDESSPVLWWEEPTQSALCA